MKKTVFAVFVLGIVLALAGCSKAGRDDSVLLEDSDSQGMEFEGFYVESYDPQEMELEDLSVVNSDSRNVEFEDFLVERCIREALGKSLDEDVTEEELSSLRELTISWEKDITLGLDMVLANCSYTGYVNLADLKYLTGLEVLRLDFYSQQDVFENMDAIANCRQLKSLAMPLPLLGYNSHVSGYMGKGYSYLRDIFAQLPVLEIVDFGVTIPEQLQELLQPDRSERKIVFAESEKSLADMVQGTVHNYMEMIEEAEDILILSSEELMQTELTDDEYEKYKGAAQNAEDVFIYLDSGEVFDCEILKDFRNIKTLVICDHGASVRSPESQVIHLEALSKLPDLCSLSLYHVQVDFEGCAELSNLRELYLTLCESKGSFVLPKLPLVRELSFIENNSSESGMYVPWSDIWVNMPELHYFHGSFLSVKNESLPEIFANIPDAVKIETLVLDCRGWGEEDFMGDILPQITEDLALKTLFFSITDGQIDLNQVKCNGSLQNFAYTSRVEPEHLVEFIITHPNLSAVTVRSSSYSEIPDEDVLAAYYNDVIEAAVRNPSLSMLDVFNVMELKMGTAWVRSLDMMSLYEAGIYDNSLQLGAFWRDMDVETYYQTYLP